MRGSRVPTVFESAWSRIVAAKPEIGVAIDQVQRGDAMSKVIRLMREIDWKPKPEHFVEGLSGNLSRLSSDTHWKFVARNITRNGVQAFIAHVLADATMKIAPVKIDDSLDLDLLISLQEKQKPAHAEWGAW